MLSLSLGDDFAWPSARAIDGISRQLIHTATSSRSVSEFLEQAATILFDRLALEGVGIWLTAPYGGPPKLMAAAGNLRGLNEIVISPRPAPQHRRGRQCGPSDPIAFETFRFSNSSRAHVAASMRCDDVRDQFPTGWLVETLGPAIQLVDAVTQARESTSLAEVLVGASMNAIVGLDLLGQCKLWNEAAEELFGWPASDALNRPLRIIPRKNERGWQECVRRVLDSGLSESLQILAQRWDGSEVSVDVRVLPLRCDRSALPNLLLCIRDQTPICEAGEWRLISAAVAQAAHAGTDGRGAVRECLRVLGSHGQFDRATIWLLNEDARKWSPWPPGASDDQPNSESSFVTQGVLAQLLAEQFVDLVGPVLSNPSGRNSRFTPAETVLAVPLPSRQAALVLESSSGNGLDGVARESLRGIAAVIGKALRHEQLEAEMSQLRQRVVQAEKLEALGLLTTSVAHDLNNILTIIFGYADLAKEATSSPGHLNEIEKAADAATQLTRQLLSSGRTSRNTVADFDVAVALGEIGPLLKSLVGPRISLHTDNVSRRTLSVRMPRTDFDQIVLNLVANARDAMPEGGTIHFQLSSCETSLRDLNGNPALQSGPCVQLRVIDTGCGMTADIRDRMFQPFFTTKNAGHGTGVGLATVRQIVDRAAGGISVETSPGAGTAFTILLPQTISDLCPRNGNAPARPDPRGDESILIAHEDPRIRDLLTRILELKGYHVHALSSGRNDAPTAPDELEEYDLLLADVSSAELLRNAAQRSAPKLPPRLLTISDLEMTLTDVSKGFLVTRLLVKPFSSQQLAIAVRGALDSPPTEIAQRPRMLSKRLATESEYVRQIPPTA